MGNSLGDNLSKLSLALAGAALAAAGTLGLFPSPAGAAPCPNEAFRHDLSAALPEGLEELKENPEAALSEEDNPFEKANKLAEKYKYGDCSGNP